MLVCVCCGGNNLENVWDLPRLPLTGIYVENWHNYSFQNFHDEKLLFCRDCSHMQLSNPVDPTLLYLDTYSHRTSESSISMAGNDFLRTYLENEFKDQKLGQVLEIGCNDGALLQQIRELSIHLAGFDPVLTEFRRSANLTLAPGFGETVDYADLLSSKIDLVISAHTFEHIVDPRVTIQRLKPYLNKDFSFVIEVPSSVSMTRQGRFDQVFPQHVNYYSPRSMAALLAPLGLHLRSITHNFKYWGGTQILLFTTDESNSEQGRELEIKEVTNAIELFKSAIRLANSQLNLGGKEMTRVCLGAAQMLPILAYHLGFDDFAGRFLSIFDDNPNRQGKFFPGIPLPIEAPFSVEERNFQFFISAPDSGKPLVQRAVDLGAKNIILPLGCF
jgi:hypothetical protein